MTGTLCVCVSLLDWICWSEGSWSSDLTVLPPSQQPGPVKPPSVMLFGNTGFSSVAFCASTLYKCDHPYSEEF